MTFKTALTGLLFLGLLAAYAAFQYGGIADGPHEDVYEGGDERLFFDISTHSFLGSPFPRTSMPEYAGVDGFYMRVPPLYTRLSSLSFQGFGHTIRSARLVSFGFSLLTLLGLFLWSCLLFPPPWPLLPPLLAGAVPVFQLFSRTAVLDMTYTFFSLMGLGAYAFYDRRRTLPRLLLLGVAAGLALATKQLAVILIGALWAHHFVVTTRREPDVLRIAIPSLRHFVLMLALTGATFLALTPSFLDHPLLAAKQLVWMELITKVAWAVKGARFPRPDAFFPLDVAFFLGGFVALAVCRLLRRPLPPFFPFVILAFAPGFLFPNAAHYTLSLVPILAITICCAIIPPRDRKTAAAEAPCGPLRGGGPTDRLA
jgi:4-amino-4-deoxy-L-arabinose transferase-like glycosyltransferase